MTRRAQAEEKLLEQEKLKADDQDVSTSDEVKSTLHELRVHQIELEMQNEELQRLQIEADALRSRYFDLYDLAPVAFLTLSEIGVIKAANHTAEELLGYDCSMLTKCSIAQFIHKDDYAKFRAHRKMLFETGMRQTFELRFLKHETEIIWIQVVAVAMLNEKPAVAWLALNDITQRKAAENDIIVAGQLIETARITKLQMNELQSQLKPHFMFNALSAVIAMCYTDGPMAAELLTKFSRYLRLIFNSGDYEAGVTVKKTLELVEMYTELEKSRFGDRLKVVLDVDSTLLDVNIIPLVVQPLVENAIRHGVSKKIEGGTVHLRIKRLKNFVEILVSDNGVGMPKEQIQNLLSCESSPVGISISSIDQRVFLKSGKKLKIRSIQGEGTLVRALLPLGY